MSLGWWLSFTGLSILSVDGCAPAPQPARVQEAESPYVQHDARPPIVDGNPDPTQFSIDFERCKDFATIATAEDPLKWSELFAAAIRGAVVGAAAGAAGGAIIAGGRGASIGAAAGGAGGAGGGAYGVSEAAQEEHRRRRREATEYCLRKLGYEVIAY